MGPTSKEKERRGGKEMGEDAKEEERREREGRREDRLDLLFQKNIPATLLGTGRKQLLVSGHNDPNYID